MIVVRTILFAEVVLECIPECIEGASHRNIWIKNFPDRDRYAGGLRWECTSSARRKARRPLWLIAAGGVPWWEMGSERYWWVGGNRANS